MKKLSFRADRWSVRAKRVMVALLATLMMSPFMSIAQASDRGSVTNLPLPRYVSIKSGEVNVRRGPSLTHRVDWVFTRENMPVEITAEHGHWRRVRDRDGAGGWVHYSLLSGTRTVIVDQDLLALQSRPDPAAPAIAKLEQGVVARLDSCNPDWCRLSAGGYRGWAPKTALWGVKPDEVRE
jgi:SH3-like domain-containing protein